MPQNQALEIGFAVMQDQMKRIIEDNEDAKKSRKETYQKLEMMDKRLHLVEMHVSTAAPTLAEFIVLKHKVAGAGLLGKWLWAFGGVLIGVVFAGREAVKNWLLGN
ncbi:hypothetical protein HUU40_00150 [candidate division KSB1 bacterium]|nr:hypothetical protein [candidate division KSB1 bacterium]